MKQAELGAPIAELCRQHGISEQSYYRWKKIYGGMEPSEARELKQLREENMKLKRLGPAPAQESPGKASDVEIITPDN